MTDPDQTTTPQPAATEGDTGSEAAQVFSVVSSERKFDGTVASVRVDEVVMPGGGTAKREVVEHGGAVAVVALDTAGPLDQAADFEVVDAEESADMVILIEQYRHPLGRRLWELPAGLLDVKDEPALAAAKRELFEETGYAAEHWSVLLDVATSPGFTEETVRIYLATGLTLGGRPDSEHEEADLRVVRVPLSVAVESALAGKIVNVMAVAGILAADAVLRGSAVIVDRSDESAHDQNEPWTVFTGAGAPAAPPLPGAALPADRAR
ncbi:MAG: NUDIX hydrolase [Nakamurella sp.]